MSEPGDAMKAWKDGRQEDARAIIKNHPDWVLLTNGRHTEVAKFDDRQSIGQLNRCLSTELVPYHYTVFANGQFLPICGHTIKMNNAAVLNALPDAKIKDVVEKNGQVLAWNFT